ncbi:putative ferric-chelate reductase 1 [Gigaspora margarita]|uniref:Putative ferric-chelate reductase 1 n=1 Tax=Gigaspora margarita TaxID=4874 RepID=A0A8H3XGH1_GIGMA|nr:putative ferric-chelate reductase 1 [Gigaspora margarita]
MTMISKNMFWKLLNICIISLICLSYFTFAYPSEAGTCDVDKMVNSPHGSYAVESNGGFSINTTTLTSPKIKISISGPESIKGLLIYVQNDKGEHFGEFNNANSLLKFKSCGKDGKKNTLTHNSKEEKKLPLDFEWSPESGYTNGTVRAIVLVSFSKWYKLDNLAISS